MSSMSLHDTPDTPNRAVDDGLAVCTNRTTPTPADAMRDDVPPPLRLVDNRASSPPSGHCLVQEVENIAEAQALVRRIQQLEHENGALAHSLSAISSDNARLVEQMAAMEKRTATTAVRQRLNGTRARHDGHDSNHTEACEDSHGGEANRVDGRVVGGGGDSDGEGLASHGARVRSGPTTRMTGRRRRRRGENAPPSSASSADGTGSGTDKDGGSRSSHDGSSRAKRWIGELIGRGRNSHADAVHALETLTQEHVALQQASMAYQMSHTSSNEEVQALVEELHRAITHAHELAQLVERAHAHPPGIELQDSRHGHRGTGEEGRQDTTTRPILVRVIGHDRSRAAARTDACGADTKDATTPANPPPCAHDEDEVAELRRHVATLRAALNAVPSTVPPTIPASSDPHTAAAAAASVQPPPLLLLSPPEPSPSGPAVCPVCPTRQRQLEQTERQLGEAQTALHRVRSSLVDMTGKQEQKVAALEGRLLQAEATLASQALQLAHSVAAEDCDALRREKNSLMQEVRLCRERVGYLEQLHAATTATTAAATPRATDSHPGADVLASTPQDQRDGVATGAMPPARQPLPPHTGNDTTGSRVETDSSDEDESLALLQRMQERQAAWQAEKDRLQEELRVHARQAQTAAEDRQRIGFLLRKTADLAAELRRVTLDRDDAQARSAELELQLRQSARRAEEEGARVQQRLGTLTQEVQQLESARQAERDRRRMVEEQLVRATEQVAQMETTVQSQSRALSEGAALTRRAVREELERSDMEPLRRERDDAHRELEQLRRTLAAHHSNTYNNNNNNNHNNNNNNTNSSSSNINYENSNSISYDGNTRWDATNRDGIDDDTHGASNRKNGIKDTNKDKSSHALVTRSSGSSTENKDTDAHNTSHLAHHRSSSLSSVAAPSPSHARVVSALSATEPTGSEAANTVAQLEASNARLVQLNTTLEQQMRDMQDGIKEMALQMERTRESARVTAETAAQREQDALRAELASAQARMALVEASGGEHFVAEGLHRSVLAERDAARQEGARRAVEVEKLTSEILIYRHTIADLEAENDEHVRAMTEVQQRHGLERAEWAEKVSGEQRHGAELAQCVQRMRAGEEAWQRRVLELQAALQDAIAEAESGAAAAAAAAPVADDDEGGDDGLGAEAGRGTLLLLEAPSVQMVSAQEERDAATASSDSAAVKEVSLHEEKETTTTTTDDVGRADRSNPNRTIRAAMAPTRADGVGEGGGRVTELQAELEAQREGFRLAMTTAMSDNAALSSRVRELNAELARAHAELLERRRVSPCAHPSDRGDNTDHSDNHHDSSISRDPIHDGDGIDNHTQMITGRPPPKLLLTGAGVESGRVPLAALSRPVSVPHTPPRDSVSAQSATPPPTQRSKHYTNRNCEDELERYRHTEDSHDAHTSFTTETAQPSPTAKPVTTKRVKRVRKQRTATRSSSPHGGPTTSLLPSLLEQVSMIDGVDVLAVDAEAGAASTRANDDTNGARNNDGSDFGPTANRTESRSATDCGRDGLCLTRIGKDARNSRRSQRDDDTTDRNDNSNSSNTKFEEDGVADVHRMSVAELRTALTRARRELDTVRTDNVHIKDHIRRLTDALTQTRGELESIRRVLHASDDVQPVRHMDEDDAAESTTCRTASKEETEEANRRGGAGGGLVVPTSAPSAPVPLPNSASFSVPHSPPAQNSPHQKDGHQSDVQRLESIRHDNRQLRVRCRELQHRVDAMRDAATTEQRTAMLQHTSSAMGQQDALRQRLRESEATLAHLTTQLLPMKSKLAEYMAVADRLGLRYPFAAELEGETMMRLRALRKHGRMTLPPCASQAC